MAKWRNRFIGDYKKINLRVKEWEDKKLYNTNKASVIIKYAIDSLMYNCVDTFESRINLLKREYPDKLLANIEYKVINEDTGNVENIPSVNIVAAVNEWGCIEAIKCIILAISDVINEGSCQEYLKNPEKYFSELSKLVKLATQNLIVDYSKKLLSELLPVDTLLGLLKYLVKGPQLDPFMIQEVFESINFNNEDRQFLIKSNSIL